jgi:hypothetical protein
MMPVSMAEKPIGNTEAAAAFLARGRNYTPEATAPRQGFARLGTARLDTSTSFSESPFPTGRLLLDGTLGEGRGDGRWRVVNDGTLFTFTQDLRTNYDPLRLEETVGLTVTKFPRLGGIFTFKKPDYSVSNLRPYAVCTMPTLATLNEGIANIVQGLPAAGIQLVQTGDLGNTPAMEYDLRIRNNEYAISKGQRTFIHDIHFHGIEAALTKKDEKVVFDELVDDIPLVKADHGDAVMASYASRLAEGFDIFTIGQGYASLPSDCLMTLECNYTDDYNIQPDNPIKVLLPDSVLERAREKIAAYPSDVTSMQERVDYYNEVERRLR